MPSDFCNSDGTFNGCRAASATFVERGPRTDCCWEFKRRQTCVVLSRALHVEHVAPAAPRNRNTTFHGSNLHSIDTVGDSRFFATTLSLRLSAIVRISARSFSPESKSTKQPPWKRCACGTPRIEMSLSTDDQSATLVRKYDCDGGYGGCNRIRV